MTKKNCNSKERENNTLIKGNDSIFKKSNAHIRLKSTIALIIILIVVALICIIGVANNIGNIQNILGIKMQQEEEEEVQFLSYQIYDNKDSNKLKIIVTINSETGIEYVKKADGTTIQANNKTQIGLDYIMAVETEEPIIIKEVGKEEVTEKIIIEEAGNEENPVIIMNADQLLNIQKNTDKLFKDDVLRSEIYYKLGADIDLTDIEWTPIGKVDKPFEGILNGDEHTISNFTYSDDEGSNVGLFGYAKGTLDNIKLNNCEVTGKENIGILVGNNIGTITNIQTTNVKANGTTNTGILTGYNSGEVSQNTIQGEVVATADNAGGIVGNNAGQITTNNANVTVNGGTNVGGIVGNTTGEVNDNTVTGTINATGDNCGGIIGHILNNDASGNNSNVTIYGMNYVGGICGIAKINSRPGDKTVELDRNKAIGVVNGVSSVGGLMGGIHAEYPNYRYYGMRVSNSYSNVEVNSTEENAGGLIGYCYGYGSGKPVHSTITIEKCLMCFSV